MAILCFLVSDSVRHAFCQRLEAEGYEWTLDTGNVLVRDPATGIELLLAFREFTLPELCMFEKVRPSYFRWRKVAALCSKWENLLRDCGGLDFAEHYNPDLHG